jgi:hypothetical protein
MLSKVGQLGYTWVRIVVFSGKTVVGVKDAASELPREVYRQRYGCDG